MLCNWHSDAASDDLGAEFHAHSQASCSANACEAAEIAQSDGTLRPLAHLHQVFWRRCRLLLLQALVALEPGPRGALELCIEGAVRAARFALDRWQRRRRPVARLRCAGCGSAGCDAGGTIIRSGTACAGARLARGRDCALTFGGRISRSGEVAAAEADLRCARACDCGCGGRISRSGAGDERAEAGSSPRGPCCLLPVAGAAAGTV
jgi:hypothetical protein